MPVPTPRKGEKRNAFVSRCISKLSDTDPDRPKDQRIAMCYTAWRKKHGGKKPVKRKNPSGMKRKHGKGKVTFNF